VCVLAPDLRGRGHSAALPGPYGIAGHLADLITVLDHAGARRAVLAGHSMGAYCVARLAAEHPERAASVVLLDGGLPTISSPGQFTDQREPAVGPTMERLEMTFGSTDEYLAGWRTHPAYAGAWNADVEAFVRHDAADDGRAVRCVVSEEAVRTETTEMLFDRTTRTALRRVRAPVRLLRAQRGLFDDDHPVIPLPSLETFIADHPHVSVEEVADVNHYTLVLGESPGPRRVANAIEAAARELVAA
jgi:lipase